MARRFCGFARLSHRSCCLAFTFPPSLTLSISVPSLDLVPDSLSTVVCGWGGLRAGVVARSSSSGSKRPIEIAPTDDYRLSNLKSEVKLKRDKDLDARRSGHILRSTGRKDRHSKVCTAKGPRDRRVRLAAHTAIQFYDVQDRLGYDRPSKAVDWLIKNAKVAIDQLEELPAWTPTATVTATSKSTFHDPPTASRSPAAEQPSGQSGKKPVPVAEPDVTTAFSFGDSVGGAGSNSFLPPSLDSDAIANTIKSFLPMAAGATSTSPASSPPIGFQNYRPDFLGLTGIQNQDLRLSLQSFQDPIFHHVKSSHHHHYQHQHQSPTSSSHNSLLAGSAHLGFDIASAGWAEPNRRTIPWNVAETNRSGGFGGFAFSTPTPQALPLHSVLGLSQYFSQREPLQSSNSASVHSWAEAITPTGELQMHPVFHPSVSSTGFASEAGFSGLGIPARIQGDEEHGSISNKLPSASRH
ncbi:hypothetical protein B296_00047714 [Ensete ventricosum]|uniref:TCP domain-containing protein n=1 Tax=Ensete ventricosum TaxID=4639 RepID=A0A426X8T8_ENSVE|nr:hypothetical protein B296_00047714 [Ensete ventricosum]